MSIKRIFLSILLCFTILCLSLSTQTVLANSNSINFIILSQYEAVTDIGDEFYILAITSNGKKPTWKSNNTKVASVNTYGKVVAKRAGSATITAKIKNAEASVKITVNKTNIDLSTKSASIEHGETLKLTATTSNGSTVTWKSSKRSIATVNEYGTVIGLKPGQTTITAKADGSIAICTLTVKSPIIELNKSNMDLYRTQTAKLTATVSSNITPKWKSNRKNVAIVDETGTITALKNGVAIITATVDGVSKTCQITVHKPKITLTSTELTLKKGDKATIHANVSSGNLPTWSSSNANVVSVNQKGEIIALQKGTAYIYAKEDGTTVKCKIRVTQ